MIPVASFDAYHAARRRAAFVDRSSHGRIFVSGADRASYLQGLLTNDIAALRGGQGCYAAYLTAQGRMITDLWVYELGDVILVRLGEDTERSHGNAGAGLLAKLDAMIFSEDVQLADAVETFAQIAIIGPESASIVGDLLSSGKGPLDALTEHGNVRHDWNGTQVIVTRVTDLGEAGFELYVDRTRPEAIRKVIDVLRRGAVPELDGQAAEAIRLEAGVPLFHRDMDEDTIPLEAGIESRAISQTKGCYVGQEVIVRILHRGHGRVARRLVGLRLSGTVPLSGTPVVSGDREIGHVTSATFSPALNGPIALAYLHRDFVDPGTQVSVERTPAQVSALPFASATSTT